MTELKKNRIVFRADGNRNIGLGHVYRCAAMAELLLDNFEIAFAICKPDEYILKEVKKVSHKIISLPVPTDLSSFYNELNSHLNGTEVVVLDGYNFNAEYENTVKMNAAAVISIDDIPSRHFAADCVINFCGAIRPTDYSKEFYTQLYLGFDYLFLRSPFLRVTPRQKANNGALLLNMGGTDSGNETEKILKEILSLGFSGKIVIVVGQSFIPSASLKSLIDSSSLITVKQGISAQEMFNTMAECVMAILPPSTVALEYLSTGGTLFINQTAENQRCIREYLLKKHLAFDYSEFSKSIGLRLPNPKNLSAESHMGFDGSSLLRVKNLLTSVSLSTKMNFRKAASYDDELTYAWATDAETRRYAYSTSEISWPDHAKWFKAKITDSHCDYFIVEIDSNPIGQIRFDLSKDEAEVFIISYLVDKNWRGRGLGTFLLIKGVQKLIESRSVKKVIGYVQNINLASIKAFERASFLKKSDLKYVDSSRFELLF